VRGGPAPVRHLHDVAGPRSGRAVGQRAINHLCRAVIIGAPIVIAEDKPFG
jgi:hypothetical protein